MKKIENIREALDVFNERTYRKSAVWKLSGDGSLIYNDYKHGAYSSIEAILIANNLSGYYTALESETERARVALRAIHELADSDLRNGCIFVCHSSLHQIEANARAFIGGDCI